MSRIYKHNSFNLCQPTNTLAQGVFVIVLDVNDRLADRVTPGKDKEFANLAPAMD